MRTCAAAGEKVQIDQVSHRFFFGCGAFDAAAVKPQCGFGNSDHRSPADVSKSTTKNQQRKLITEH